MWARCHFAGEASGNGWIVASASLSGAARPSVSLRVANSRSPGALRDEDESSRAIRVPLPRNKCREKDLVRYMFRHKGLIARGARLPQHVAAFERRHVASGDEQMVRQAV